MAIVLFPSWTDGKISFFSKTKFDSVPNFANLTVIFALFSKIWLTFWLKFELHCVQKYYMAHLTSLKDCFGVDLTYTRRLFILYISSFSLSLSLSVGNALPSGVGGWPEGHFQRVSASSSVTTMEKSAKSTLEEYEGVSLVTKTEECVTAKIAVSLHLRPLFGCCESRK